MFLSSKTQSRLATATKARLNTHSHKLDNMDSRKKGSEGSSGPPSPSEVIVFNNTSHSGGNTRTNQHNRNLPEVPQVEEIHQFFKELWDRKMQEAAEKNLTVLYIRKDNKHIVIRGQQPASSYYNGGSSQSTTPKQKNSPTHSARK